MENQYFEDESKSKISEDDIIKRIKECEMVVEELRSNVIWQILITDAVRELRMIDNVWQEVSDEKKLNDLRIYKLAYKFVVDLPRKYKKNLEDLKEHLEKHNEISKDYEE